MGGIGDLLLSQEMAKGPTGNLLTQLKAEKDWQAASGEVTGLANSILEYEAGGNAPLKSMARGVAARDVAELERQAGRPYSMAEKQDIVQRYYDGMKADRDAKLGASRLALSDALDKGGGRDIYDVLMTPQQRQAIDQNMPWRRLPTQAMYELAKNAPLQRKGPIFAGAFSPEEKAQFDKLVNEDVVGRPVGTRGWAGQAIHALGTTGRGAAGTVAGAAAQLQQSSPGVIQDVPPVPEGVWNNEPLSQSPRELWNLTKQSLARLAPGFKNIGGINIGRALDAGTGNTFDAPAAFQQGRAAALGESDDKNSLTYALAKGGRSMLQQAVALAQNKAKQGKIPNDQNSILAEAKRLVVANDMLGGVNPAVGQFAAELGLDPVNWVNPAEVVGGAAKLAAKAPGISQGVELAGKGLAKLGETEAAQKLASRLTYMPQAKALESKLQDVAPTDIVAKAIAAPAQQPFPVRDWASGIKESPDNLFGRISDELAKAPVPVPPAAIAKEQGVTDATRALAAGLQGGTAGGEARTTGQLGASAMRAQEAMSHETAREFATMAAEKLKRIEAVPENVRTPLLWAWEEGGPEAMAAKMHELNIAPSPKIDDMLRATQEFGQEAIKFKQETGAGYRWETADTGGKVLKTAEDTALERYIPYRKMNPEGEAEFKRLRNIEQATPGADSGLSPSQAMLHPKSALERSTDTRRFFVGTDPAKQIREEAYQVMGILPKAAEMKGSAGELGSLGILKSARQEGDHFIFDNGLKLKKDDAVAAFQRLSEKTSVPWVNAGTELSPVLQAITGKSGEAAGKTFWAPKPVMDHFHDLAPVIGGNLTKFQKFASDYNRFMDRWVRPAHAAAKLGRTVLGGSGFAARNAAGAIMVTGVNHGLAAANPGKSIPVLQTVLAAAGFGADEARATKFALPSGETTTLGWVMDTMKKLGALDQFEAKSGVEAFTPFARQGPLMKGVRAVAENVSPLGIPLGIPGTRFGGELAKKTSMMNVNRGIDNYQRVAGFMQFLHGTSSNDVARAFDLMSQYSGNYRRLSDVERYALRDVFGFYSWNRFILPHFTAQLVRHPERFTPWAKARGFMESTSGLPNLPDVTPDTNRDLYVPLPKALAQPGSHEWAVSLVEDPLSMLLGPLTNIIGSGKAAKGGGGSQASPLVDLGIGLFMGFDTRTGQPITDAPPFDLDELADDIGRKTALRRTAGPVARFLLAPIERPTAEYGNLIKLLKQAGNSTPALSAAMAFKAQRDFGLLGVFVSKLAKAQVAPAALIPGLSPYAINPTLEGAWRQADIAKRSRDVRYSMQKSNPLTDLAEAATK